MRSVGRFWVIAMGVALWCAGGCSGQANSIYDFRPPFLVVGGNIVSIASTSTQDIPLIEEAESQLQHLLGLSFFVPPRHTLSHTWQLPTSLGSATNLVVVFLQTAVSGTVPTQLGLATSIQTFTLATNDHLKGTLPSQVALMTNLFQLRLFDNPGLAGQIPSQLGLLSNLDTLNLAGNGMTGRFPSQLAQLTQLHDLDVSQLDLTGTIPTQLVLLTALRQLVLINLGRMEGTVPGALLTLPLLSEVAVSDSAFELSGELDGPIAPLAEVFSAFNVSVSVPFAMVGSPATLKHWIIGAAGMPGQIPSQIGLYTKLQNLQLYGNRLSGPLPSQLALLTDMYHLGLNGNQLGLLPSELWLMTSLVEFGMSQNALRGFIPTLFGVLTNLRGLYLDTNSFSGPVPSELGQLTQLTMATLTYNRLSGTVPSQLGLLTRLVALHMGYNALSGTIPPSVFALELLESPTVEHNRLRGTIPPGASPWTDGCDESGLDDHACAYACGACAHLELQLRGCDWKGRGRWCVHFAWLLAALLAVVCALTALQLRLCADKPRGLVAVRAVRGAYCTVELFLDLLFTAGSTGAVFHAAMVVFVGVAVGRLVAVASVVPRLADDWSLGVLVAVVLASVVDVAVAGDVILAREPHVPLHFTLSVIALGLVESCIEGVLQIATILGSDGTSLVTVMAFGFSAASFCGLVGIALVLSLSYHHSRLQPTRSLETVALGTRADSLLPLQSSAPKPNAPGPSPPEKIPLEPSPPESSASMAGVSPLEIDEPSSESEEGKKPRRPRLARWKVLCGLCCVVTASLCLPNGQVAQYEPTIAINNTWPTPNAQPLRETGVAVRKQTTGGTDMCNGGGTFVYNPPFLCLLGEVVAMVDSLGATDIPLEQVLRQIPSALFVALSEGGSEIPTTIGELSGTLVLVMSQFDASLPSQIGKLSDLALFDYDSQLVTSNLPSQVGLMASLSTLRVRTARMQTMPSEIGRLANIEILEFETMVFQPANSIPTEYGLLSKLRWLMMTDRIHGPIPSQFGQLGNLTVLWSPEARLTGELPTQLGLLGLLSSVQLQGNRLQGVATPMLLDLPLLQDIDLNSNDLSGQAFSENWRPPAELASLDLSLNPLSGTIPSQLGLATKLTWLRLSFMGELSGTIPTQLGLLQNLTELAVSGNALSGELPSQLALLGNLQAATVAFNSLRGRVPATFSDAQRGLWLRDCDYSGLDERECARTCPRCEFNELRAAGCDDRGFGQVCLPFYVVLLAVAVVGFGMQRAVRKLVSTRVSLRELVLASAVSAVGTVHTLLDVMFADSSHGWIGWTAASVLTVAMLFRVVVVMNEFVRLHFSLGVRIGNHAKMFAMALLFCVVDPSTISSIVADLDTNGAGANKKLLLTVGAIHLVQDIPMLCIQAVAVSDSALDIALQALLVTVLSLLVASRLWLPWVVSGLTSRKATVPRGATC